MDNFENQSHSTYQTIPPTTVMMAGSIKEESPMRMDEDVSNSNANNDIVSVLGINASNHTNDIGDTLNFFNSNDMSRDGNIGSDLGHADTVAVDIVQNSQTDKKSGSNVIVDESPLQLQMEKNKECKFKIIVSKSKLKQFLYSFKV